VQLRPEVDAELVEKMRWDPEAEAREQLRQRRREEQWSSSANSSMPQQSGPEAPRGKKKSTDGRSITDSTFAFGDGETDVDGTTRSRNVDNNNNAIPPPPARDAAPWAKAATDDLDQQRQQRARVTGGRDQSRSRVSWSGYGTNDPALAMAEPIGVSAELHHEVSWV
jgi:hypothetical protein